MPTFYDVFELENIDINNEMSNFYIIRISNNKYKFRATTQDLNSSTMQAGDPETRIKFYWPINRAQLNQADLGALFPDDKIRAQPMTVEELQRIFSFNPIEQEQQTFGPQSPQSLLLDLLEQAGISTQDNQNVVANYNNLGGLYAASSALKYASILTQNNFTIIANYIPESYTEGDLDDLAYILSGLQQANLLTQVNFDTVIGYPNRDYFYQALLCLVDAGIMTQENFAVLSNRFNIDRTGNMYLAVALTHYTLAGLLTQNNFEEITNLNFDKTTCHYFAWIMIPLHKAGLLNEDNISVIKQHMGNDQDIFAFWQATNRLAKDNLLTQSNFTAIAAPVERDEYIQRPYSSSTNVIIAQLGGINSSLSSSQRPESNNFPQIEKKIQELASYLHITENNFIGLDSTLIEELYHNKRDLSELIHEYQSISLDEIIEQPHEIRMKMYQNSDEVGFLRQYIPLKEIVAVSTEKCNALHLMAPLLICHKITAESLNTLPVEVVGKLGALSLLLMNGHITQEIANSFVEESDLQQIIQFTSNEISILRACFEGINTESGFEGSMNRDQVEQTLHELIDGLNESSRDQSPSP